MGMPKVTALAAIESLTAADVFTAYSGKHGNSCGCNRTSRNRFELWQPI